MPTSIEDLVRAVQQEQAERALHPQRILAALPQRRARMVRRRNLTLVAVSAAVLAVAAVPLFPTTHRTPSSDSSTRTPKVLLGLGPSWLPMGLQEYSRASQSDSTTRSWNLPKRMGPNASFPNKDALRMSVLYPGRSSALLTGGQSVDVNGAPGVFRPGKEASVAWSRDGNTVVELTTTDVISLGKDDLLRIARSVGPDRGAVLELPFRPPSVSGLRFTSQAVVGTTPTNWFGQAQLTAPGASSTIDPTRGGRWAIVTYGNAWSHVAPGATALTVRGHSARYQRLTAERNVYSLDVDLGGDRALSVLASRLSQVEMIALAEATRLLPRPDFGWIGS